VAQAANWALLVAGSNSYSNYRHQSDICDMYQILHMNGIPDSHIIVMMYDDIANNPSNPRRGEIINWPGGPDVYKGVPHDYTGNEVTAANFLKILQGQDMGGKKTIKSTADDNVFVFYSDHGSVNLVAFPTGGYLYAKDLNAALADMASKKKFKELVFYIEACESGSMFNNKLPSNIKIYGFTASHPSESSWACDYDSSVRAYLNDCWSRNFMQDMRKHHAGGWTLQQEADAVGAQTTQSKSCQYGDMSFINNDISLYVGKSNAEVEMNRMRMHRHHHGGMKMMRRAGDAVAARMATLAALEHQIDSVADEEKPELRTRYVAELAKVKRADSIFGELRARLPAKDLPQADVCHPAGVDEDCLRGAIEAVQAKCGELDDYMMDNIKHLARFCAAGLDMDLLRTTLAKVC